MGERLYPYGDRELPSVTTITGQLDKSGPLTYWAANCACDYIFSQIDSKLDSDKSCPYTAEELFPIIESARKNFRKVSRKALDIGSAVHQAIECYLQTGEEPQNPSEQILSAFLAFLEWKDSWQTFEPIKTEYTVYYPEEHGYAGTLDLLVKLDGNVYVIDFKSSKGIYPEMRYQVAAYRAAVKDRPVLGCGILRLDKETGYPEWKDTSSTYEKDLNVFMKLCELWWARRGK